MFMSLCSYVRQFTLEHNDISVQILMSLCHYVASVNQALPGTPIAAFTGTADSQTCIYPCYETTREGVHQSEQTNLRFSVSKTTKDGMFGKLGWLID